MNKKFILLSLISLNAFSFTGDIKTGFNLKTDVEKKEDVEVGSTSLDLTLFDLGMKINDNVNVFGKFKTYRKNIVISDLYNKDITLNKRANHDIMPKIGLKLNFDVYDKLKSETELIYYVDDFYTSKTQNEDGTVNESYKSYYIDGDEKEALGNTIIKQKINGSIKDVTLNLGMEYKANQLRRFDKDKSYFKFNIDSSGKVNEKIELSGEYDLNIDLNQLGTKFDPTKVSYDEYPDYLTGDYVLYYEQNGNLEFKYNLNSNSKLNTKFDFNHFAFYSKTKPNSKYKTYYDAFNPNVKFGLENEIVNKDHKFLLENNLIGSFEYRNSIYKGSEGRDDQVIKSLYFSPKIDSKLSHIYEKDKLKTNLSLNFVYGPKMLLEPIITSPNNLEHELSQKIKLDLEYKLSDDHKLNLNVNQEMKEDLKYEKKTTFNITNLVKLDYYNKISEKLELDTKLSQSLNLKTAQKSKLRLNNMDEKLSLKTNVNYTIFDNLKLENKLEYTHKSGYNYVLRTESKPKDEVSSKNYGDLIRTNMENVLSLESSLKYDHKINEQVKLNTVFKTVAALEILNLRSEKMFNYNTSNIESYQELPTLDTDVKSKPNIGGKILISPSVEIVYTPIKQLNIETKLELNTLFARKTINKIEDDYRPDKDLYGAIDKKFDFKKITPSIHLNIGYSW